MANPAKPQRLACEVSESHPVLDYTFRFAAGYVIECPVRIFGGEATDNLPRTPGLRLKAASSITLGDHFDIPAMPEDFKTPHQCTSCEHGD